MRFVGSSPLGAFVAAALFTALLMAGLPATASSPSEEIQHLLDFIAASTCAFIRNGVAYDGAEAAAHVKDKYEYYRSDIHSAEDFIARAASRSELSGKPYLVRCGADATPAADWLARELTIFRQQP
jgi:hypothetical protein